MIIKDADAKKIMDKVRSTALTCAIEGLSTDEIEGRSDMQVLVDELGWVLYKFENDGWVLNEDLAASKWFIRKTKGGKEFPVDGIILNDLPTSNDIKRLNGNVRDARDRVNEYNRLKRLMNRLEKQGYVSQW